MVMWSSSDPSPSGVSRSFQQIGEQLDVIRVDLRQIGNFHRITLVMRNRVMRVGHADLWKGHAALFAPDHHRNDTSEIALIRQYLQVEHQLDVLFVTGRNARGMVDRRQILIALRLGFLNTPFHITDRLEIFDELPPIGLPQRASKLRHFLGH